jgi:hypothetical protein
VENRKILWRILQGLVLDRSPGLNNSSKAAPQTLKKATGDPLKPRCKKDNPCFLYRLSCPVLNPFKKEFLSMAVALYGERFV